MKRFAGLALVLSAVLVFGPAREAEACSCAALDPAEMLEDSDAAFVGTLVEKPTEPVAGEGSTGVWVFEVEEWKKGDLGPQVGVHSPLHGAACGFELAEGDKAGIFLHNDRGRPSGSLCATTTPEALLTADQPLVFDGAGPPVFVIGAPSGRARLATLDASGRLLGAVEGDEPVWTTSVCPDRRRMVEKSPRHVSFLDLSSLEVEDRTPIDAGEVDGVWCLGDGEVLVRSWDEEGQQTRLRMLGSDEDLAVGQFLQVRVGIDMVAVQSGPREVELISLPDGDTVPLSVPDEISALDFAPDGDRLMVAHTAHQPDGSYETRVHVYDVSTAAVTWTSDILPDSSVTGWFGDDHLAASCYPIDADAPEGFLLEVGTGETTEADLRGWEFFPTRQGAVSAEEGVLYLTDLNGATDPVGTLPSPNHRLVAVLDPDADIEATPAANTQTSPPSTQTGPPLEAAPAPTQTPETDGNPSVTLLAAGAALVVVSVGIFGWRRRRIQGEARGLEQSR